MSLVAFPSAEVGIVTLFSGVHFIVEYRMCTGIEIGEFSVSISFPISAIGPVILYL